MLVRLLAENDEEENNNMIHDFITKRCTCTHTKSTKEAGSVLILDERERERETSDLQSGVRSGRAACVDADSSFLRRCPAKDAFNATIITWRVKEECHLIKN